jgi:hypothetical protein
LVFSVPSSRVKVSMVIPWLSEWIPLRGNDCT